MKIHGSAKLGPAGRLALTEAIAAGMSQKAAAAAFCVSPATAHRWWHRRLGASPTELACGAWLCDRSSRPRHSPRLLAAAAQELICECRRGTGWGPRLVAGRTGHPHSTVWKVLRRHGISRLAREPREPANRYEWPCPGDLLHIDVSTYARFERPGHALTGDRRSRATQFGKPNVGYEHVHAAVDDHSRLAFAQLHDDEQAKTVVAFVGNALAFYEQHGIRVRRILTDNAWTYTKNRRLRELLADHGIEHWTTRPYRPRTNGKVERFHQTMAREWAYGLLYRSSHARAKALPDWLRYYNEHRPHSGIDNRPPISRVHNLRGQDT
jgi:transposase InsO family protein